MTISQSNLGNAAVFVLLAKSCQQKL